MSTDENEFAPTPYGRNPADGVVGGAGGHRAAAGPARAAGRAARRKAPPPPAGRRAAGRAASPAPSPGTAAARAANGTAARHGAGPPYQSGDESPTTGAGGRRGHGRGGGRGAGRGAGRGRGSGRGRAAGGRRYLKPLALGLTLVLAMCGIGGWLYVRHLDGNIQHGALSAGDMPSSSGGGALNILMIGSDSRNSAADLKLGGAKSSVGGPVHGDVEMLLHVSADRSNASLLSIPRDTMVNIPACKDSKTGKQYPAEEHVQITDSLSNGGPSCTVYTWYKLTGIPINHYMMVDFGGVVSMADAVGGVPVCVDDNVYDPDSHLRLSKGDHVIKGEQALEWLRTRHGFGDGSDLYRTQVQHMYLTAMMRRLKSAGTLSDPSKVFDLAEAGTKALSVDDGLDSVTKLAGLGTELKGIQLNRLTTLTMPFAADPQNPTAWVIPKPVDADQIFSMIRNDVPLDSHGKPAKKSSASSGSGASGSSGGSSVAKYAVNVQVQNGSSTTGRADQITTALKTDGFNLASSGGNAPQAQSASTVNYPTGDEDKAKAVAAALKLPSSAVKADPTATMTTVVVGGDWPSGDTYGGKPAAGSVPTSAPKQSGSQSMCAKVNPAFTY